MEIIQGDLGSQAFATRDAINMHFMETMEELGIFKEAEAEEEAPVDLRQTDILAAVLSTGQMPPITSLGEVVAEVAATIAITPMVGMVACTLGAVVTVGVLVSLLLRRTAALVAVAQVARTERAVEEHPEWSSSPTVGRGLIKLLPLLACPVQPAPRVL